MNDIAPPAAACPCCRAPGPHQPHSAFEFDDRPYALERCTVCHTLFYVPPPVIDYTRHTDDPVLVRHYVEFNAGIGTMLKTLAPALIGRPPGAMLDLGCGFGFAADIARALFGWHVQGVEPSAYGRLGGVELGLPMLDRFLDYDDPFGGQRFDIVHCSEVIEHVTDPQAFLALLRHYLTPGGTIILTTPSAEAIDDPTVSQTEKLALLSPGAHVLLFTQESLARTLREAGLPHVTIRRVSAGLVAYASTVAADFAALDDTPALLMRYYRNRVASLPDGMARRGFATRLFIELVSNGDYAEAKSVWDTAGFVLPDHIPPVATFTAFMAQLPTAMSVLAYCRGMLELNYEADPVHAAQLFALAAEAATVMMQVAPALALSDQNLYWSARFHHAQALRARDPMAAVAAARSLLAQLPETAPALFGPPDPSLCLRARSLVVDIVAAQFSNLVNQGQYSEADAVWQQSGLTLPHSVPPENDPIRPVLALLAHCRAILALNHMAAPAEAAQLFGLAAAAALADLQAGAAAEPYWNARFHHALALCHAGDVAGGLRAAHALLEPGSATLSAPDIAWSDRARALIAEWDRPI